MVDGLFLVATSCGAPHAALHPPGTDKQCKSVKFSLLCVLQWTVHLMTYDVGHQQPWGRGGVLVQNGP